jgi:hypothetical protein
LLLFHLHLKNGLIIASILQMRKLRHREVKEPEQSHTASTWHSQDLIHISKCETYTLFPDQNCTWQRLSKHSLPEWICSTPHWKAVRVDGDGKGKHWSCAEDTEKDTCSGISKNSLHVSKINQAIYEMIDMLLYCAIVTIWLSVCLSQHQIANLK